MKLEKAFDLLKADRLRSYALDEKIILLLALIRQTYTTEQQLKNTKYSDEKIYEEINKFISQQGLGMDDVLAPEFEAVTEAPATK